MTRRQLISLAAAAGTLRAQPSPPGYPGVAYRDYSKCFPGFLSGLAKTAYERRNAELAKITTREQAVRRQHWVRTTFWDLIGGRPDPTPLNIKTTGSFDRAAYRVEKLIFESQPGLYVTANLYIPKGSNPPYPGVLFQPGHALNGKAGATYQRACQGLVQLGYLVLTIDPMGQGERVYYPDASGIRTRLGSADDEHTHPGKQMLLTGDTSTRFQLWDAIRALDVLASHPLVDPKRLASTGQSGGGTLTMFLAAVDDRLSAAAVMSGNTENVACANFNPPGSIDDAEQDFPGSGPLGFDRWDTLYPLAPKPLLISVSDKDFFGTYSPRYIENGWEEFRKLRNIYALFDKTENLKWGGTPMPHGLSHDTRLQIYNWFALWLQGDKKQIRIEPPVQVESDETLWATQEGNVIRSLQSRTPFSMNRERTLRRSGGDLLTLLKVDHPPTSLRVKTLQTVPWRKASVQVIEVQSAPEVYIPAWLYTSSQPTTLLVLVQQGSRLTGWQEEDLFHQLALRGLAICVPDVRGVGDLTPEFGRGAARHAREHATEDMWAWSSLILGKPLLGQRVTDILAILEGLSKQEALRRLPIRLAAQGRMTVPAQIAAMADKRVDSLYLAGGLSSFRSVVDLENYNASFANFVPRFLEWGDLPDVTRAIAPRRVVRAGMVDGAGRTVTSDIPDARWDVETLDRFARGSLG